MLFDSGSMVSMIKRSILPQKVVTKTIIAQARDRIDDALATAMHAMCTTAATTLGNTPGSLAFARDMFLNVPLIADWQAITCLCKHHVNENLCCANKKQCEYGFALGQQVLKKVHNQPSYE